MDATGPYLRAATFAALLAICCGRIVTEPAVLLAAAPERAGAEKSDAAISSSEEAFFFDVARPTKVVIWSKFIMKNGKFMEKHVPNCTLERAFRHDAPGNRSVTIDEDYDISDADVVVFNLAPLEQNYVLPRHKPQGQLWVAGCWEPISFDGADILGDCSLMNDTATMSRMDGVASYHNDSMFPAFFTPPTEAQLRRPAPKFRASDETELATYVSSDCRVPWREGWVSAINQSLVNRSAPGVLSYGKCLRTAEEAECSGPDAVEQPSEDDDTVEEWVFAKFANRCMARPFALVAENSLSPWYVTEKIWNALATGAVPVYLGPSQVKDLVPPGSVIFAADYATSAALADALLNFTEADFERARAWKEFSTEQWGMWRRARLLSRATLLPRLCAAGAGRSVVGGLVRGLAAEHGSESISPPIVPMLQASASVASLDSDETTERTAEEAVKTAEETAHRTVEEAATTVEEAAKTAEETADRTAEEAATTVEEAVKTAEATADRTAEEAIKTANEAAKNRTAEAVKSFIKQTAEEAAENRTAEETLDALEEAGDPTAEVARSTVTSIDDFLRRSDQQEEDAMRFLSRAVSKIRVGRALRKSTHGSLKDFGKDIDDFEKSLGAD